MFNVTGNFQYGTYHADYPNKINGFQTMVTQQDMDAQRVIDCFEAAIAAGYNPNDGYVLSMVLNRAKVSINDLDEFNLKRIRKRVQEIWERKNNGV